MNNKFVNGLPLLHVVKDFKEKLDLVYFDILSEFVGEDGDLYEQLLYESSALPDDYDDVGYACLYDYKATMRIDEPLIVYDFELKRISSKVTLFGDLEVVYLCRLYVKEVKNDENR